MTDKSPSLVKSLCQNALKVRESLCYLRIVFLSILCEEAYYCSSDTMINCEAINAERKNRTENSILEYMKKSTKRVHEEDDEEVSMQREIAELNRLKRIKNRKYRWPGQMAVYSQPIEVTLYLTGAT
jgi:hypothetical protein